jgi:copper chaperone
MEILVFKTNLRYRKNILHAGDFLNQLQGIIRWNVDLHDKDKVLRIEARDLNPRTVEHTLSTAGYSCEELL